jgi:hypothetical protein
MRMKQDRDATFNENDYVSFKTSDPPFVDPAIDSRMEQRRAGRNSWDCSGRDGDRQGLPTGSGSAVAAEAAGAGGTPSS